MKITELRELNVEELTQKLSEFRKELFDLRMARAAGKLEKPHPIRQIRRGIAQIETLRREKGLPAAGRGA